MHQHVVEIEIEGAQHLGGAAGFAGRLDDVAHRHGHDRPRSHRPGSLEQGQKLEAHLPAAERERLDQDQLRHRRMKEPDQAAAAACQERRRDPRAVCR
jgi:hypothetical protein